VRWIDLERQQPRLAEVGRNRLLKPGVVLIATIRRDGTPRVSPTVAVDDTGAQRRYADAVARDLGWNPEPGKFHLFRVDIDDVTYLRYDSTTEAQHTTRCRCRVRAPQRIGHEPWCRRARTRPVGLSSGCFVEPEPDLQPDLDVAEFAVDDVPADLGDLEPVQPAQGSRGATDGALDRVIDPLRRRADYFGDSVGTAGHLVPPRRSGTNGSAAIFVASAERLQ